MIRHLARIHAGRIASNLIGSRAGVLVEFVRVIRDDVSKPFPKDDIVLRFEIYANSWIPCGDMLLRKRLAYVVLVKGYTVLTGGCRRSNRPTYSMSG